MISIKQLEINAVKFGKLEENVDYEILTVGIFNSEMCYSPCERIFGKHILEIVGQKDRKNSVYEVIDKQLKGRGYIPDATPLESRNKVGYLLTEDTIDLNTAIDCGFGILKMLKGKYKGKFFLFNSIHYDFDSNEELEEVRTIMLDIYLQIAVASYDNKGLEGLANSTDGRMYTSLHSPCDDGCLLSNLDQALRKNKGGNNILQFPYPSIISKREM